jgi:hypothetical protein
MKRHNNTLTPASGQSDVLTEQQAADYLHVKTRTLREWRARRGLGCFKPTPKVTLYSRAAIDAWLERSKIAFPPKSRARSAVAPAVPPPRSSCQAAVPESEAGHE